MSIEIVKLDKDFNRTKQSLKLEPNWVTNESGLPDAAVMFADAFGKHLTAPYFNKGLEVMCKGNNALTTTQLRNFFSEIRRIQAKKYESNPSDFYMLKPKLAYAKARSKSANKIEIFVNALTLLINEVINSDNPSKNFLNFVKFVEATVAYHKAHEHTLAQMAREAKNKKNNRR